MATRSLDLESLPIQVVLYKAMYGLKAFFSEAAVLLFSVPCIFN